jgi:hypothetical protein
MNMKINHKEFWSRQPAGLVALLLGAVVVLPVLAGTSDSKSQTTNQTAIVTTTDTDMRVEVLSLTLSKLERDNFGNAVSPFNDYGFWKEQAGTVVLAKITPAGFSSLRLLGDKCQLITFTDDAGTDLFTNAAAKLGDDFFAGNRILETLTAKDSGCFGVRLRSARLPARAATRVTAEVLLTFAPTSGEKSELKSDVAFKIGQVTSVGPVKIKFQPLHSISHHRTNQPVARPEPDHWTASFLADKATTIVSVAFFSEASDQPILLVKDLDARGKAASFNGTYKTGTEPGEAKDDFSSLVGYGFTPPGDGKVTIKIRHLPTNALVEKRCLISTGISP